MRSTRTFATGMLSRAAMSERSTCEFWLPAGAVHCFSLTSATAQEGPIEVSQAIVGPSRGSSGRPSRSIAAGPARYGEFGEDEHVTRGFTRRRQPPGLADRMPPGSSEPTATVGDPRARRQ
jgi:hypothetical protein